MTSSPATQPPVIEGGCFCGNIRYQIEGSIKRVVNCHCTMCRRTSGAPFVSWLVVPTQYFRYTAQQPKHLDSSDKGDRYFCADCGTPIACLVSGHDKYIDITLGSLDVPESFQPDGDFYEDTKLKWL